MSREGTLRTIDNAFLDRNLTKVGTRMQGAKPIESFASAAPSNPRALQQEIQLRGETTPRSSTEAFFQNKVIDGKNDNSLDMTKYSVTGNPVGKSANLYTTATTRYNAEQTREK